MTWNWQSPDWLNFKWDRSRISGAEEQFLLGGRRHRDRQTSGRR
jgi:hypothetical protein